ncbi:MAG: helix-turn-helix domain-containing protein [Solirubrobacteraceae bacterium]
MGDTSTPTAEAVFEAAAGEAGALKSLDHQIEQLYARRSSARLLDAEGNETEIPAAALRALRLLVRRMVEGERLTVLSPPQELSTQQVAELLHVSRPHLIKLLERGEIPFHKVGTHRRIASSDLLAYRAARDAKRQQKLDELARISQELPGGYR